MQRRIALLLAITLVATSCAALGLADDAETAQRPGALGDAPASLAMTEPDAQGNEQDEPPEYDGPDSTYIFEQDQLHTFALELSDEDLAELDDDPRAEEYVEAVLSFEGEPVGTVGVRYKGSVGAFVGCLADIDPDNEQPVGPKTCTKLSMKIKVNWDGSEARFYDLRKLQLHSQNNDATQMHERLGYWLFDEMGVPAPRSVHARLVINGEFVGLFALTEQVDGRFARQHFDDGTGNIFKERWPLDENNDAVHERVLASGLKTNEDEDSAELFAAFGEALAAAGTDDELRTVIETYMDVEETMAFIAVDRAIANDDGAFHFYCFSECANHNLYWYANPTTKKMHLIPWDLDNAFENIVSEVNAVTPLADHWTETSNNCEVFAYGVASFPQRSAACDRLIAGLALFDVEYQAAVNQLLDGPFAEGVIEAKLDEWSAQIEDSTSESYALHPDTVNPDTWRASVADLRASIAFARAELAAAAAG